MAALGMPASCHRQLLLAGQGRAAILWRYQLPKEWSVGSERY